MKQAILKDDFMYNEKSNQVYLVFEIFGESFQNQKEIVLDTGVFQERAESLG